MALWRFAAREFDEVGFRVPIEFAVILAVGLAAMNRRESSFAVVFACVVGCANRAAEVLTDLRICEPLVGFQEDACACDILGFAFTGLNEPLQRPPLLIREINDVCLSSHSERHALRELKLASLSLKLHLASLTKLNELFHRTLYRY